MKKLLWFTLLLAVCPGGSHAQQSKIDSLKNVLETEKEDTNKVKTLNDLSWELLQTGDFDQAKKIADDALSLAEKTHFKKGMAGGYRTIGSIYGYQGNYSEALKNFSSSLKIHEELGNKKGASSSYNNIGYIYQLQGDYPEALENYFAALKLSEQAFIYNNIGTIYDYLGNYPEALKNYFAGLKISEETGDKKRMGDSYINIGVIYEEQGNYPEALKNYFLALKMYAELGNKIGISGCYGNIGAIYQKQGNYPEALKNYLASFTIAEEIGAKYEIGRSYNAIAGVYLYQVAREPSPDSIGSKLAKAMKNCLAGMKISEEIGDKNGIAASYIQLGEINIHLKQFSEARKYLNNGVLLSKEIGSKDYIKSSYARLAELDSVTGNYKQAYEHYKMYTLYHDSLFNEENTKKLVQSQMQYEFDKKEAATKAEQDRKDVLAKAELQKQKIQKYSFIGGIILLIILAGLLYNRFRLKRLLEIYQVRTDLARDLHDNIGSTLGSISYYSEMAQQFPEEKQSQLNKLLKKIEESSRELVDEMGDIVWAINPANDSSEKLILRMKHYAAELFAARNIDFSFETNDVSESLQLSLEQRKNIFLIFKEGAYNALKYAGCSTFSASIRQTSHALIIELKDNGKGFDVRKPESYNGNGIGNMRQRAAEIGAEFLISSEQGNGTQILFDLPIK